MNDFSPIDLVAYTAQALGDLVSEAVFLGGAVVGLLITDQGGVPLRTTRDVDVVMKIATKMDYYRLDERLRSQGFVNDVNGPVCRYLHGGVVVDVMPTTEDVLGFSNRWYPQAVDSAVNREIREGVTIKLISAPCFLATKLEAFSDPIREAYGDVFGSRDFADIVRVIDGRPSLLEELKGAPDDMIKFLGEQFARVLETGYLLEAIAEHVDTGREIIVIERMRAMVCMPGI